MTKIKTIAAITLSLALFSCGIFAGSLEGSDIYLDGYSKNKLSQLSQGLDLYSVSALSNNYTTLNPNEYIKTVNDARASVNKIILATQPHRNKEPNEQIAFITKQLSDIPYLAAGAMGEGDWQPSSLVYQNNAVHILQDPVYRLDGLDCQTFVQVAMALFHANNLNQFDQTILKIAYGAAGNPAGEIVHFYNRNHFADGDFNPINQKNGWLIDVTSNGDLKGYAKTTSAVITRQNWFLAKQQHLADNVRVLSEKNGPSMVERFKTVYSQLNYPNFGMENVSISYLPREQLAIKQSDGSYQPNQMLLDKIPTPALVEIVNDIKKWNIGIRNIRDLIGSELNISHMGLLYRQTFQQGELIYSKITCRLEDQKKVCDVKPVACQKKQCNELMFAQATNAYPDGYFWYTEAGRFVCSPNKPTHGQPVKLCNRVERLPLFDYMTREQYKSHRFMDSPSILGLHIEKLSY